MAPPSQYDDPDSISKFLERMATNKMPAKAESGPQAARSNLNPETPAFSPNDVQCSNEPEPTSWENAAPPANTQQWSGTPRWQAPSASPFPRATPLSKSGHLDLIQDENGFVTQAAFPNSAVPGPVLTPRNFNTTRGLSRGPNLTPTQYRLLASEKPGFGALTEAKLSESKEQTKGYMDTVVDNFRKSHQPEAPGIDQDASSDLDSIPFPEFDETPINPEVDQTGYTNPNETPIKGNEWQQDPVAPAPFITPVEVAGVEIGMAQNEAPTPFPSFDETPITNAFSSMRFSEGNSQCPTTATNMTVVKDEPVPAPAAVLGEAVAVEDQEPSEGGVMVEDKHGASDTAFKHSHSPTIIVTAGTETDDSTQEHDEYEDRENLTRFKTWGTPTARNKPRSRQRTIVLSGLPRGSDYSFVQSLIHGGAIEVMNLGPSNSDKPTISAYITFISADACDRYYDKYPNGFDVRHQGKKWPVFVTRREGVDVVSGLLGGYLECGATRVVKANNADDDWGIVALKKLAEGTKQSRRVEAVHDAYTGTRTITFRFASIAHAAQFKTMLTGDDDWEGCWIEFAEDPCAKATGFHF